MARRPVLEFWYEFASTYSYLAAMRIERLAEEANSYQNSRTGRRAIERLLRSTEPVCFVGREQG
ncbi:MAG TPA: hypothetical protein VG408_10160, partial [Actinomycetota bacterium]|nr:hypothetical protein [Actinomycetota bacterium]